MWKCDFRFEIEAEGRIEGVVCVYVCDLGRNEGVLMEFELL